SLRRKQHSLAGPCRFSLQACRDRTCRPMMGHANLADWSQSRSNENWPTTPRFTTKSSYPSDRSAPAIPAALGLPVDLCLRPGDGGVSQHCVDPGTIAGQMSYLTVTFECPICSDTTEILVVEGIRVEVLCPRCFETVPARMDVKNVVPYPPDPDPDSAA